MSMNEVAGVSANSSPQTLADEVIDHHRVW